MRDAVYVCAWISHLCMHKRVEACVCVRCPSAVMADDHMCLMGWDMTEMGTKWNIMARMKNHAHYVCTILHAHKVRGGMCLFNGRCTSGVFYSSITKMQIKMIQLDPMQSMGSN